MDGEQKKASAVTIVNSVKTPRSVSQSFVVLLLTLTLLAELYYITAFN